MRKKRSVVYGSELEADLVSDRAQARDRGADRGMEGRRTSGPTLQGAALNTRRSRVGWKQRQRGMGARRGWDNTIRKFMLLEMQGW